LTWTITLKYPLALCVNVLETLPKLNISTLLGLALTWRGGTNLEWSGHAKFQKVQVWIMDKVTNDNRKLPYCPLIHRIVLI